MPDLIAPSDEELTAAEVAAITGTPKPARQAAELADSLDDAAELLQHDDKRLTGKHYRTKVQALLDARAAAFVTRDLDGEWVNLQRQGELALYAACRGQEAAQVGATACLRSQHARYQRCQHRQSRCRQCAGLLHSQSCSPGRADAPWMVVT